MVRSLYRLWEPGIYGEWIVAFTATLTTLTCGQMFAWTAAALPKIRDGSAGFTMTSDEESWMVTMMFIGNIITPIPAGYIMDWIGRKNSLMIFDILAIVSWVMTYYGESAEVLYVVRFIQGAWLGFMYTITPVLIAEVVRPEIRGSMGGVFGMMTYVGALMESLLGTYVSYSELALYSIIPPVLVFVIFLVLPESPYYHLIKGDRQEAIASMEWLRGMCDVNALAKMEESVREQLENSSRFLDIVKVKHYRKAFVVAATLVFFQRFSGMSLMISYGTLIIPNSFLTNKEGYTALNIGWIIGSGCSYFLLDRFTRRALLALSCYGSGLTFFAASIWFLLRDYTQIDTSTTQWLPTIFIICSGVFFASGFVSIPTMIQGEMFPVNIKGKASAVSATLAAISSAIVVRLYHPLDDFGGDFANVFFPAFFSAFCGTFTLIYMIETKGKSLELIQDELCGKKMTKNDCDTFVA